MLKITIKKTLLILIVALVILSGINLYLSNSSSCIVGDSTACANVQNSEYGKIFGVKVSLIGPVAFIFLLFFYYYSIRDGKYKDNFYEIYVVAVIIGFVAALYFIYLQLFVLKAICINCAIIDGIMLLVGVLTLVDYLKEKRR